MGKTAIPCYLLITPMSENEQPGQDLLEVDAREAGQRRYYRNHHEA